MDKIDMSLDDIIKRDRISTGKTRRGGGPRGAGRAGAIAGRKRMNVKAGVRKIGAVGRQMKTGGMNRRSTNFQQTPMKSPRQQTQEKWLHDKFVGEIKSASLMISNLDYGVTDQDIRELFSEFGQLKKAAVHYDSSGRSLGKADVVFMKIVDANKALKKYNGVPLDGRPMNIQPMVASAVKASLASRIGNGETFKKQGGLRPTGKVVQRGTQRTRQQTTSTRGARRGRGGGGRMQSQRTPRNGQKRSNLTAEQLDADLESYTNKV